MKKAFNLNEKYSVVIGGKKSTKTGKELWEFLDEKDIFDDEGYQLKTSIRSGEWAWVKADVDMGYNTSYNQNNKYHFTTN